MLFNSIPFLAFALLFFGFWSYAAKSNVSKWAWITAMSFLFYGWWDWRFIFLLAGTGSIDYWCGKLIVRRPSSAKFWLMVSVLTNLASLGLFKYGYWLATELDKLTSLAGITTQLASSLPEFTLILPVGISFYTFNSLSYTIDLYRRKAQPARNWLHFMSFISFFPHLVAGPIIRAKEVLGQLEKTNPVSRVKVLNGLQIIAWGLFQKAVLADNLAVFVNNTYGHMPEDMLTWWMCMLAFSFQIYFDFAGYSTMARGLAKLCGIHFRLNFNKPYRAATFGEFWKRWHISLSSFFRDYVYIPLGGNRLGKFRTLYNRWITMLLSGLWHGANLTFLCWGAVHALLLSFDKPLFFLRNRLQLPAVLLRIPVFIMVLLAWVFFRSESLAQAFEVLGFLFGKRMSVSPSELLQSNAAVWLAVSLLIENGWVERKSRIFRHKPVLSVIRIALLLTASVFLRGPEQDFIYFQF